LSGFAWGRAAGSAELAQPRLRLGRAGHHLHARADAMTFCVPGLTCGMLRRQAMSDEVEHLDSELSESLAKIRTDIEVPCCRVVCLCVRMGCVWPVLEFGRWRDVPMSGGTRRAP